MFEAARVTTDYLLCDVGGQELGDSVPLALMTRPQGVPLLVPANIDGDAIQQELAFAVASSAEAVALAALALAEDQEGDALEDAEGELSDHMHEALTPLRREARALF